LSFRMRNTAAPPEHVPEADRSASSPRRMTLPRSRNPADCHRFRWSAPCPEAAPSERCYQCRSPPPSKAPLTRRPRSSQERSARETARVSALEWYSCELERRLDFSSELRPHKKVVTLRYLRHVPREIKTGRQSQAGGFAARDAGPLRASAFAFPR